MCGVRTVWTERRCRSALTGHAAQAEAWEGAAAPHVTYLRWAPAQNHWKSERVSSGALNHGLNSDDFYSDYNNLERVKSVFVCLLACLCVCNQEYIYRYQDWKAGGIIFKTRQGYQAVTSPGPQEITRLKKNSTFLRCSKSDVWGEMLVVFLDGKRNELLFV